MIVSWAASLSPQAPSAAPRPWMHWAEGLRRHGHMGVRPAGPHAASATRVLRDDPPSASVSTVAAGSFRIPRSVSASACALRAAKPTRAPASRTAAPRQPPLIALRMKHRFAAPTETAPQAPPPRPGNAKDRGLQAHHGWPDRGASVGPRGRSKSPPCFPCIRHQSSTPIWRRHANAPRPTGHIRREPRSCREIIKRSLKCHKSNAGANRVPASQPSRREHCREKPVRRRQRRVEPRRRAATTPVRGP
jgi:hypothetical protein